MEKEAEEEIFSFAFLCCTQLKRWINMNEGKVNALHCCCYSPVVMPLILHNAKQLACKVVCFPCSKLSVSSLFSDVVVLFLDVFKMQKNISFSEVVFTTIITPKTFPLSCMGRKRLLLFPFSRACKRLIIIIIRNRDHQHHHHDKLSEWETSCFTFSHYHPPWLSCSGRQL